MIGYLIEFFDGKRWDRHRLYTHVPEPFGSAIVETLQVFATKQDASKYVEQNLIHFDTRIKRVDVRL